MSEHIELSFKLKTPCKDCPFRRDVAPHEGVAKALPEYIKRIEDGKFVHTCHKTDERSDGFVEGYKGPVEHCAGALIFTKKLKIIQTHAFDAAIDKKFDYKKLDMSAPVFDSIKEMAGKYYNHFIEVWKKRKNNESEIKNGSSDNQHDGDTGRNDAGCGLPGLSVNLQDRSN